MKRYTLRLSPEAEDDLVAIHAYVLAQSQSERIAAQYVERIGGFSGIVRHFPRTGTVRDEIRAGLRIVGFERSVSLAFLVEDTDVIFLRIMSGGEAISGRRLVEFEPSNRSSSCRPNSSSSLSSFRPERRRRTRAAKAE